MIGNNKHLIKYQWIHAFSAIIYCDRCHKFFQVDEVFYKKIKKVEGINFRYNYCLKCANELGLDINQ